MCDSCYDNSGLVYQQVRQATAAEICNLLGIRKENRDFASYLARVLDTFLIEDLACRGSSGRGLVVVVVIVVIAVLARRRAARP